jgi:hypothetical protein
MLLLRPPTNAYTTLALSEGVEVEVRPATSYELEMATQTIRRLYQTAGGPADFAAAYGLPLEIGAIEDWATGFSEVVLNVELGMQCIRAWRGIGTADGAPAEITRPNLTLLLLQPDYLRRIATALTSDLHLWSAEGNASPPSPSGAPGAATPIAETAPAQA